MKKQNINEIKKDFCDLFMKICEDYQFGGEDNTKERAHELLMTLSPSDWDREEVEMMGRVDDYSNEASAWYVATVDAEDGKWIFSFCLVGTYSADEFQPGELEPEEIEYTSPEGEKGSIELSHEEWDQIMNKPMGGGQLSEVESCSSIKEENEISSVVILPQYDKYIRRICVLLAWKGLDINLKSMDCFNGLKYIDSFYDKYYEGMKKYGKDFKNSKEFEMLKERYSLITEARKNGVAMFKEFLEKGYEFAKSYLGSKTNKYRQFEKAGCLALFGENEAGLSENQVKTAARYAVRDFFRWLNGEDEAVDTNDMAGFEKGESSEQPVDNRNEVENEVDEYLNGDANQKMKLCDEHGISQNLINLYIRLEREDNGTGRNELKLKELRDLIIKQYISGKDAQDWLHDINGQKIGGKLSEEMSKEMKAINEQFYNLFNRINKQLF